ncbi:terminase, partial [Salmonella enterica subsp. enterica serovar Cerro]|nr:terminase [Salmonella enterica subsp. enterica serovar Cerro]EHZ7026581.1 terminase [Salmonella enterica]EBI0451192.1 terminase [Salmonella enterica subsp. enterica serovar Cerro]EBI0502016.1 terminase [Salmonella enterica subsp. enterica serovar Cerro]ELX5854971.1 terminase [Salmonella enterica]
VEAYRCATSSGHGIGKSALTAWVILYIMSTRPFCKGVVTANTSEQLRTKTWGELGKWKKRCITGHWFEYNNGKGNMNIYHVDHMESWRCDGQTCREENSESFAGLHAANSSPFYIFDEASAVPDKIWEVAEGGLTDGEPFWFAFGNPTRNTGRFRECFRKFKHRWRRKQIDSRLAKMTNKELIEEWRND